MKHDDYIVILEWHNLKQGEMIRVGWIYFILKVHIDLN
jgi:hypothetical protein